MNVPLAKQWLNNTRSVLDQIENTQIEQINKAAEIMADSIQCGFSPIRELTT